MTFSPRPYQQLRIDLATQRMLAGRNGSVVLPTGTGKTKLGLWTCEAVTTHPRARAHTALWLCDRRALVKQTAAQAADMGVAAEVRTIQGLRSLEPGAYDMIVLDESHKFLTDKRVEQLRASGIPLLGLTATPRAGDGRHTESLLGPGYLGGVYTLGQAILDGWLTDCKLKMVDLFETDGPSGIKVKSGDFDPDALAEVLNTPSHNDRIAEKWLETAQRSDGDVMLSAFFCCNCDHADDLATAINAKLEAAGHPKRCAIIHSRTGEAGRVERGLEVRAPDDVLAEYRAGKYIAATSVSMVAEGFDYPELQCGVLVRPTKSDRLLVQQLGRILRLHPSKDIALFMDCTQSMEGLDLATIYDVLDPKETRDAPTLTGVAPVDEFDEGIPMLSDVVARMRDASLFSGAVTAARTMPWQPVADGWALALTEDRRILLRASKFDSRKVGGAMLYYQHGVALAHTLFKAEPEAAAFAMAEDWVRRQYVALEDRDVRKGVVRWYKDRAPPTDDEAIKLATLGIEAPRTHGEAVRIMRHLYASGRLGRD